MLGLLELIVFFFLAFVFVIVLLVVVAVGSRAVRHTRSIPTAQKPEDIARERYARGELSWKGYQELLLNLLKDRYTRDEIDLSEYEDRVGRLLEDTPRELPEGRRQRDRMV